MKRLTKITALAMVLLILSMGSLVATTAQAQETTAPETDERTRYDGARHYAVYMDGAVAAYFLLAEVSGTDLANLLANSDPDTDFTGRPITLKDGTEISDDFGRWIGSAGEPGSEPKDLLLELLNDLSGELRVVVLQTHHLHHLSEDLELVLVHEGLEWE